MVPVPALLTASLDSAQAPATQELDALLDAITALKAQQKRIEQELEPLLVELEAAMESGSIDPVFSHNDWAFNHSPGRLSYAFPPAIQQQERQLKEAREAAVRQGTATEKRGKAFWTIRAPSQRPPRED